MGITFENVDGDFVHTTQGPKVRFDFVCRGGAGLRALLTVGKTHIGYSTQDGERFGTTRTLEAGGVVHFAPVMVAAAEVAGRRDYAFTIAVNGVIVVVATGIPEGQTTELDDQSFQLRVL